MTVHADKKSEIAASPRPEWGGDDANSLDFYRRRAIALRNQAMRHDVGIRAAWLVYLTVVGVFMIGFILAIAPVGHSNSHATAAKPNATSIR